MKRFIYIALCCLVITPAKLYGIIQASFSSSTALVSGTAPSFTVEINNGGAGTSGALLIQSSILVFDGNPSNYNPTPSFISSNSVSWNGQSWPTGITTYTGDFQTIPSLINPVLDALQLFSSQFNVFQTFVIVPNSSYYTAITPQDTTLSFDATLGIANLTPSTLYPVTSTNGTAVISGTNIDFMPTSGFTGTASFTYRAQDTNHPTYIPATVTITVTVTPPFTATLDLTVPKTAVSPGDIDTLSINLNVIGSLPSPNPSITSNTSPVNPYTISGTSPSATTISGSSAAWNNQTVVLGNNIFTQSISYGAIGSPTIITITAAATGPYSLSQSKQVLLAPAGSYALSTMQDTPVDFDGTFGSIFTPANLTINSTTNGSASIAGNGIITFTPNSGFFGTASFTYTDSATNITITVTVTVIPNVANLALANEFLSAYLKKYITPYM